MKRQLLILALLLISVSAHAQLDARYHTLPEIHELLFDLQGEYPDRIAIDSIGHSQQDSLPIYLVKISDDVQVDLDRPTVLFVGHIHGEEILGIEICLDVIQDLVTNDRPQFRQSRQQLETYFIVTMNPEGLNVVHGIGDPEELILGADYSYRKNKRDNVGDGRFRYQISGDGGNDTSGVDLNRNFEPNWIQGDSLYTGRPHNEWLDYYKGHSPFSEAEVQAMVYAHELVQPLFGTTIHSSRQGGLSEKIFYPWDWGGDGDKVAPDQDILDDFATEFALKCDKQGGGHFTPGRSGGRNGKRHDWSYAWGGWITVETETSS
ncbi:hypothetical protein K8I28_05820, partial [bacterium]|nr:hypothetical protein [bacterium]